ncbi:TPA: hypothetical protein EYG96_03335 [Candidatus Gracilibacteria bacterium]|nr:hypothetical protein [Candidatus Peregrinibacteria bacterium]HIQ57047.1 hypothetical protein [Candidatus Gracilibacteria bacterium]HIQ57220.1 hypothetical protein [Candidatus Gracilibacteria bacterium]
MNNISTFLKTSFFSVIATLGFFASTVSANEIIEVEAVEVTKEITLLKAYLNNSEQLLAELPKKIFATPAYLFADASNPFGIDTRLKADAAKEDDLQTSVISIINYLLLFLGLALLGIIIYNGAMIIFSQGDEQALTDARQAIIYAIIGVAVIVLSYTLVDFIANVATGGGSVE